MDMKIIVSWIIWCTCNCNLGTCKDDNTTIVLLNTTLSWSGGQQACRDRNGTMLSEQEARSDPEVIRQLTSGNEYWTGMHQYLSDWIGVYGWEYSNNITQIADVTTHELEWSSPGSCQEICHKYRIFAIIGGSTCICIPSSAADNSLFAFESSRVSNWTVCSNSETPNTCGGTNNGRVIASLYVDSSYLVSSVSDLDGNCMSAQCDGTSGNAVLKARDCEIHKFRSCENVQPATDLTGQSAWKQAYEGCLNITSIYAMQLSCLSLTQLPRVTKTSYWIGYKRQFYTRQDKGNNVNVAEVQKCQSCNTNGSCQYQSKSQCGVAKRVMCRVPYSDETATTALTPETETTRETRTFSFSDITRGGSPQPDGSSSPPPGSVSLENRGSKTNTQDTVPLMVFNVVIIVLVTSLILVVTLSISCICFIVRRYAKRGTKTATKTKNNEMSETAEHNPDFNAYLTISERSCHLYGDVQYDKAEERKSVSLHSQIYDTSVSDKSGGSDDYLTPTVKTVKENTTGSLSSEGYDDVITSSSQTRI
ncbi:uncharacterized protein LOC125657772 isoform X1 [Ostrea edulis]|uniref:uncharacterized protein LOC125657772 isoform X1 n=1 Tax=Ostrea edulis TaxID=37623 RepID=UPI0024AE9436|nr:uncharacterized protein LOC125657772 isoform X1 [Ostrea edulis]XP_056005797.1 uncharacterized protein LOC125657772 isoform X1 [Ostrea edulis]